MWIPPPRPPPQYEPQHDVIRTKMRYRDHIMAASGYGGGGCCGTPATQKSAAVTAAAISVPVRPVRPVGAVPGRVGPHRLVPTPCLDRHRTVRVTK